MQRGGNKVSRAERRLRRKSKKPAEGEGGGENVGRLGQQQGLVEIRPLAIQGHWISPSKERTDHSRWPRLEHGRGCELHGQAA